MAEQLVGTVSHYFGRPQVGVVKLTGGVKIGDVIHIVGHGADFEQKIASMELDHGRIQSAAPGIEVAIQVEEQVRAGDRVFRSDPDAT